MVAQQNTMRNNNNLTKLNYLKVFSLDFTNIYTLFMWCLKKSLVTIIIIIIIKWVIIPYVKIWRESVWRGQSRSAAAFCQQKILA